LKPAGHRSGKLPFHVRRSRVTTLNLQRLAPSEPPAPEWTRGPLRPPTLTTLGPSWFGFRNLFLSLVAHLAGAAFLAVAGPWLSAEFDHNTRFAKLASTVIEVRLPLYVPSKSSEGKAGNREPKGKAPSPGQAAGRRPVFELPPLPPKSGTELTLLQSPPDLEAQLPRDLKIPNLMQWSDPVKVKAPPKKFLMPGVRAANPQIPQLDAPPALDQPNRENNLRDLKMAADVVMTREPKLPVQRASSMPVRTFVPPKPQDPSATSALDIFQGDALNLVAISPASDTVLDKIKLPPGIQVAAVHQFAAPASDTHSQGKDGPGAGKGAGEDVSGTGGSMSGGSAASGQGSAPGSGSPTGSGKGGLSASGAGAGAGTGSRGLGSGSEGGGDPSSGNGSRSGRATRLAGNSTEAPLLIAGKVPIRIEHPESGNFDVVVVQSSMPEEASGVGILSGSPVYTVYLPVGRQKPWIMQYCIPKETQIKARKGIAIQLGNPAPVKAPYPRITVVPPLPGTERVMLHGFVDDAGHFRDLRVVAGNESAERSMILPLLKHWVFRPATRDGAPVTVEIVLVMPRDQV
jgi:hypothetical protein